MPSELYFKMVYQNASQQCARVWSICAFHHQIPGTSLREFTDKASIISCRPHLGPLLFW